MALANSKTGRAGRGVMRDNPVIQSDVAKVAGGLHAARAFLREMLEEIWQAVNKDGATLDQRARLRLAITGALDQSVQRRRLCLHGSRHQRDLHRQSVRAPLSRHAHRHRAGPGAHVEFRIRRPGVVRYRADAEIVIVQRSWAEGAKLYKTILRCTARTTSLKTMASRPGCATFEEPFQGAAKADRSLSDENAAQGGRLRCCPAAAAMPTICRCRSAPCTPMSSARRMRMPTSCASTHRRRWRMTASGRSSPARTCAKLSDPFLTAGEGRGAAMGARGRAGALCRRAGRARRRGEPLHRRGCRRAGRDRLCAASRRDRSGSRVRKYGAAGACRSQDQRSLGARIFLRRHQGGVRARRPRHRHDDDVSAAVVHADRVLRRRRPAQCRPRTATTCWRISRGRSRCIR